MGFNRDNDRSNVDRTGRDVDRTARDTDRTMNNVDRTGHNAQRDLSRIDRTGQHTQRNISGIDRTSHRSVQTGNASDRAGYDAEPRGSQRPDRYYQNTHDGADIYSGRASGSQSSSGNDGEMENLFSGHVGSDDISSSQYAAYSPDEIENISSSSPRNEGGSALDTKKDNGKNRKKKKKKKKSVARTIGRVLLSMFFIFVIVGCIITVAFMVYVFGFVDDSIENIKLDALTINCTSTIYVQDKSYVPEKDSSGKIIGDAVKWKEYQNLSYENRIWADLDDIDTNVQHAFVSAEDERFYKHCGVDFKRTFLAFVNMFVNIYDTKQGGSTITQQLVKNITGDDEQSPMRKIREIMRARNLEKKYSKDTILECYLNVIYLGNNNYGIEAASEYYFGKPAKKLSVAESACIAAITKSPSTYDPIKHPDYNETRRRWIIKKMCSLGYIDEKQRDEALNEKLTFVGKIQKDDKNTNGAYSYFTDAVIDQVIDDLMTTKGYSKEGAKNMLYRSGLQIYATMDSDIQNQVTDVFCNDSNFAKINNVSDTAQGAITVMDYEGHVVAVYGGRGQKTQSRILNRATQSARQPGSTMKPIGVYAPALDANLITWSTYVENSSLTIGGIKFHNYDHSTSGKVTAQNALERSLNLVPLRILNSFGPNKSFKFLTESLGISTLVDKTTINGKEYSDIGLSQLALGGCTYGLTTVELTAAYAIFGNGGKYYSPTFYTKVTDNQGKTVLSYSGEGKQAIGEDTAYIMNRMLNTVVTGSHGTGRSANFDGWGDNMFAKTGTTSDNKDRWFVGGTPYYVSAVWFGCDTPKAMNSLSTRSNPAMLLWKPVMQSVHANLEKKAFQTSDDVTHSKYCTSTGELATTKCYSGTNWGYYKKSYAPVCSRHKGTVLSSDKGSSSGKKTTSSKSSSKSNSSSTAASSQVAEPSQAVTSSAVESKIEVSSAAAAD